MSTLSFEREYPARIPSGALVIIAVAVALAVSLPTAWLGAVAALCVAVVAVTWFMSSAAAGDVAPLTVCWIAIFPLAYSWLAFPRTRPLITFDRCIVAVVLVAALLIDGHRAQRAPIALRRAAIAWLAFIAAASLSLCFVEDLAASARVLLDAFILPALFGFAILRCFDVRRHAQWLHAATCVMCIYSAAIGVAEMLTGRDLLALPGAGFYLDTGVGIPRPNGPFLTNHSFAFIGLIALFLLSFLRRMQPDLRLPQRALHWAGVAATLLMALLPLFRSVMLTLLVVGALSVLRAKGARRWARLALFVLAVFVISFLFSLAPDLLETRLASDKNIGARWAQQHQNLQIFLSHPLLGAGIGNFQRAVPSTETYAASDFAFAALDQPHSNLGAVLAETGLAGFVPYLLSQVFLAIAFWRTRPNNTPQAALARRCFMLLFISYWVTGVTLASGYYGDLNLWYILAVTVLYKVAHATGEASPA